MKIKINYTDEIKNALKKQKPVVALETTIISHGLPYPDNIECAKMLEKTVRDNGAIPATLAIIEGVIHIGINEKQLLKLGKKDNDTKIYKVSRADLPFIISNKLNGATTVAGTMILANLAGIKFFATGGIGGVHRFAEQTFDVSADLEELAKTDVTVVSAGAKAILDIPKTLEYLETKGVSIIGYNTETFPLFYTAESEYKLNLHTNDLSEIANFIKIKEKLGYTNGLLVANPVEKKYELKKDYIDEIIKKALDLAEKNKINGKEVTPFLLETIYKLTSGKSLGTNIALVKNNAEVCAKLSCLYYN
ncbi:pseudouridine-5'-phosphate glycosidase [Candidatus Gracilibacteria bacterium]|nr:pseudouridine-5'-phosphate glycosidase [Candidatus Gracilibacteria bacterium]